MRLTYSVHPPLRHSDPSASKAGVNKLKRSPKSYRRSVNLVSVHVQSRKAFQEHSDSLHERRSDDDTATEKLAKVKDERVGKDRFRASQEHGGEGADDRSHLWEMGERAKVSRYHTRYEHMCVHIGPRELGISLLCFGLHANRELHSRG